MWGGRKKKKGVLIKLGKSFSAGSEGGGGCGPRRWISVEGATSRRLMDGWTNAQSSEVTCWLTTVIGRNWLRSSSWSLTVAKFIYLLYTITIFFNLLMFSQALLAWVRNYAIRDE